jgi:hypothetical protein
MTVKTTTKPKSTVAPKNNGTYSAERTGVVSRITPTNSGVLGISANIKSMDTTGYAKGKKSFVLKKYEGGNSKPKTEIVPRGKVGSVIKDLKKGATRTVNNTTRKANRILYK